MKKLSAGWIVVISATAPALAADASRPGILGRPAPAWAIDQWLNLPAGKSTLDIGDVGGKVLYLYYFQSWCPGCHRHLPVRERSLPAITRLAQQFGRRGFQTIAVYHPKPPRDVPDAVILQAAADFGYRGPVALDRDWATLEKLYLSRERRSATSVSFLLDRNGIVRFVHPPHLIGPAPRCHPSTGPTCMAGSHSSARIGAMYFVANSAVAQPT